MKPGNRYILLYTAVPTPAVEIPKDERGIIILILFHLKEGLIFMKGGVICRLMYPTIFRPLKL